MNNKIITPLEYGKLYELGKEGHEGYSHYNDLPFYGYFIDYIGPTKFPRNGLLFLEKCRDEKLLLHYASEFKKLSFPEDQHLLKVREVVCIERSEEVTNLIIEFNLKKYLNQIIIPRLYKQNLEETLLKR